VGTPQPDDIVDVTIIGGGPTGLAAAYYAGHREATVRIIDTLPELGGQVMAIYPEKHIFDVAGHPKVKASVLCDLQVEQALQFDPDVVLNENCETLEYIDAPAGEEVAQRDQADRGQGTRVPDAHRHHHSRSWRLRAASPARRGHSWLGRARAALHDQAPR